MWIGGFSCSPKTLQFTLPLVANAPAGNRVRWFLLSIMGVEKQLWQWDLCRWVGSGYAQISLNTAHPAGSMCLDFKLYSRASAGILMIDGCLETCPLTSGHRTPVILSWWDLLPGATLPYILHYMDQISCCVPPCLISIQLSITVSQDSLSP